MFGHSLAWRSALTDLGVNPSASDEYMTSTHWHLYVRLMVGEQLFDHILSFELEDDDPRTPGAYADAARLAARALMVWLSQQD